MFANISSFDNDNNKKISFSKIIFFNLLICKGFNKNLYQV